MRDSFQHGELINYEVRQSDPLEVVAIVRQPAGNLHETKEIIAARDSLAELLDQPVKLAVVLEPVVDADVAEASVKMESQVDRILREEINAGVQRHARQPLR